MGAFRRFDPYAALAKYQPQTLATLAALAGAASDTENREDGAIPNPIPADQNQSRRVPLLKLLNLLKLPSR